MYNVFFNHSYAGAGYCFETTTNASKEEITKLVQDSGAFGPSFMVKGYETSIHINQGCLLYKPNNNKFVRSGMIPQFHIELRNGESKAQHDQVVNTLKSALQSISIKQK